MAMGLANFGGQMLTQWGMNTSNRIGTGRSLRKQMAKEQVQQTRKEAAAGIVGRVEGAKAAGLHPLVAMGSNVGSASLPVGSSFNQGADFGSSMMQDRELKARKEENEYNRSMESKAAAERKQADMLAKEESQARINLLKAQEASQRKQIADSDRDFLASQEALRLAAARNSNPVRVTPKPVVRDEDRARPQYVPIIDRFGKKRYIPNPEIYDLELPDSVGAGTLLLPEVKPLSHKIKDWFETQRRINRHNPRGLPNPVDTRP